LETWIKNDENDKEVLSVPKWMSQAFNNIDIASDLSEFEKDSVMTNYLFTALFISLYQLQVRTKLLFLR
jgi:hypothetical protein